MNYEVRVANGTLKVEDSPVNHGLASLNFDSSDTPEMTPFQLRTLAKHMAAKADELEQEGS